MEDQSLAPSRTTSAAALTNVGLLGGLILLALLGTVARYVIFGAVTGDMHFGRFITETCAWDCNWYREVTDNGYGAVGTPRLANRAFFPLYPAIVWSVQQVTGWGAALSGYICSTTFTIAAAWVAHAWFGDNHNAWRLFAFSLFLGPFSVILSTLYTESLFILLSILALNAIGRRHWLEAGVWIALLSATRVTGVLMGAALVAGFIVAHFSDGGTLRALVPAAFRSPRFILALAVAPLGILGYMAFLHLETGDALTFIHVQSTWGRHLQSPLATLLAAITHLWPGKLSEMVDVGANWAIVVGWILTALLARRGRVAEAVFCAAVLLISMSAGSGSMLRFAGGLAPLGMLMCETLSSRRALYLAAYPASAVLGLLAAISWFSGSTLLV